MAQTEHNLPKSGVPIRFNQSVSPVLQEVIRPMLERQELTIPSLVMAASKAEIAPLPESLQTFYDQAVGVAKGYLKEEAERSGASSDHIDNIVPVFARSKDRDRRMKVRFLKFFNIPVGTMLGAGNYVPIIFWNEKTDRVATASYASHELSHIAATAVNVDRETSDLKFNFRQRTGFDKEETTWPRKKNEKEKRKGKIKMNKETFMRYALLPGDHTVNTGPTFMEDEMATWDQMEIMKRIVEAPGILSPEERARVEAGGQAIVGKINPKKLEQQNRLYGDIMDLNPTVLYLLKTQNPVDVSNLSALRGIARAIGYEQARKAGVSVSNEDAIEQGRQLLQKSRLNGTTEAYNAIAEAFGPKFAERLFKIKQDPLFPARVFQGLIDYENRRVKGQEKWPDRRTTVETQGELPLVA